jgi:hypothetical protein
VVVPLLFMMLLVITLSQNVICEVSDEMKISDRICLSFSVNPAGGDLVYVTMLQGMLL